MPNNPRAPANRCHGNKRTYMPTATPPTIKYSIPKRSSAANRSVQSCSPCARPNHLVEKVSNLKNSAESRLRGLRLPVTNGIAARCIVSNPAAASGQLSALVR